VCVCVCVCVCYREREEQQAAAANDDSASLNEQQQVDSRVCVRMQHCYTHVCAAPCAQKEGLECTLRACVCLCASLQTVLIEARATGLYEELVKKKRQELFAVSDVTHTYI
jgi:hypothetical protein